MSTTPYEPSFPPSRQDYRDLIDHHYVIRVMAGVEGRVLAGGEARMVAHLDRNHAFG